MLQLLGAADEIRSLGGSCERGSNGGTKVETILCGSRDKRRAAAEGETAPRWSKLTSRALGRQTEHQ